MNGHSFEDLIVMVIEQIMADSATHKQRESYWIHTIWTLTPDGLNQDQEGFLADIKPGFTGGFADDNGCVSTTSVEKREMRPSHLYS